jgi:adenylate kinase
MTPQTILFYGRSGSGKGTQAKLLRKYLESLQPPRKVLYVQTGQCLRELASSDTYTGRLVKDVLDTGSLMPEFLPVWIWTEFLAKNFTGTEHLLFDGLARRFPEAVILDGALTFYGRTELNVVLINVSREWSFERLRERARHDDTDEDIKKRLDWFEVDVVPAINFFKNNSRYNFIEVNGEQTIENVHKDIVRALKITS